LGRSDNSLGEVTNPKLNYFIRVALTIAIITSLIGGFMVVREYVNGDHPIYGSERNGAICRDGWVSYSTGRGTCSHHGGVDHWTHPQIGFHNLNTEPYWITIASAFAFMIVFSVFNIAFRQRFLACCSEATYGLIFILYIVSFIAAIPFYILYSIFKYLMTKIKSD
jgi:hypothetical protein